MKSLLFFIITILQTNFAIGQMVQFGTHRTSVIKTLKKFTTKNHYNAIITETDSSIFFLLRDTTVFNYDKYYHFAMSGLCDLEFSSYSCDSCFREYVNLLKNDWWMKKTKINDTLYYGYYPPWPLMQIKIGSNRTVEISGLTMDKKTFKAMRKNNGNK
ncbi:MAG: hypothetical protein NTZ47_01050 [Bacteroidetes bacterium]|nr:hypothetical protein [Bacteroidota bacterium]